MEREVNYQCLSVPNKQCIIEFQSFIGNSNEFIVKELVIMDLATNMLNYFLFKPPHDYNNLFNKAKKTNKWLTYYFHNITWDEGFTQYEELDNIMNHYCKQFDIIYTTGLKKALFISRYSRGTVINYLISKNFHYNTGGGLCNSVKNEKHKLRNCCLIKTQRILAAMGKIPMS